MQMLNRYFAPFALMLILSAVYFSEPEPRAYQLSLAVLALSIGVNWWLTKNMYRFYKWAWQMRALQVWLNLIWAVPLFHLLMPYWGPMWLLFVMAPATAAMYWDRLKTLGMAAVSSAVMLALYHAHGVEGVAMSMALVHAAFIVVFSLFVHGLVETALRLRDAGLPRV